MKLCAIIPTYNNPQTVGEVAHAIKAHIKDIIVVDDGSSNPGHDACVKLKESHVAHVIHRRKNGGKGAAVKTGLEAARQQGFTHAFQIDADGQHDLEQIPVFVATSQSNPQAAVFAYPEYDKQDAKVRQAARKITNFWVNLEVGGADIVKDAMVGFRIYPLEPLSKLKIRGKRMDFDIEIAVRMAWAKIPIINLPVKVRYLSQEQGGVSHFQHVRDNVRFAWLHSRLCTAKAFRFFLSPFRRKALPQ